MEAKPQEKVSNIDSYEREKIETTLNDSKHLVAVIENYLKTVDYCNENGIVLEYRSSLDNLRHPGGAGEVLADLARKFEGGMIDMAKSIHVSHKRALEAQMIKS